jgi:hypothetical protein
MLDKTKLLNEFKHFTGSETTYYLPLFPMFRYTEGVRHLAINANAFWLVTDIFSYQFIKLFLDNPFQVWKLKVTPDNKAIIQVEDGDDIVLKTISLEYTDFPLDEFTLWFVDGILLLPSEY